MTDNIVTHPSFRGQERTPEEHAQAAGIDVRMEADRTGLSKRLPAVQQGEMPVDTLTDAEAALCEEALDLAERVDELERTLAGKMMASVGQKLQQGMSVQDVMQQGPDGMAFEDQTEAEEYFGAVRRRDMLTYMLQYRVCERVGIHQYTMGIRQGLKIVRGERKW